MDILSTVQSRYPAINKAGGEFLLRLALTGITKDISLAAEMAGLMLLRSSPCWGDVAKLQPGTAVLGAISDETQATMSRFLVSFAVSNGLNPKDMDFKAIPDDVKNYCSDLNRYEQPFYEICEQNKIERELFPFVAAATSMKLVLAGNALGILKPNLGQAIAWFHIAAGSKTVPYPTINQAQSNPV